MNLVFILLINSIFLLFILFISLFFLKSKIASSDKANNCKRYCITEDKIEEYIISGNWNKNGNFPFSSYILCIVSSLKNRAFIVKFIAKLIKNKSILIIFEL